MLDQSAGLSSPRQCKRDKPWKITQQSWVICSICAQVPEISEVTHMEANSTYFSALRRGCVFADRQKKCFLDGLWAPSGVSALISPITKRLWITDQTTTTGSVLIRNFHSYVYYNTHTITNLCRDPSCRLWVLLCLVYPEEKHLISCISTGGAAPSAGNCISDVQPSE